MNSPTYDINTDRTYNVKEIDNHGMKVLTAISVQGLSPCTAPLQSSMQLCSQNHNIIKQESEQVLISAEWKGSWESIQLINYICLYGGMMKKVTPHALHCTSSLAIGWVPPMLTNGVSDELDQYLESGMFHISRKVASYFNKICKPLMNMMGHHISSKVVSMLFSLHFGGNIVWMPFIS